MAGIIQEMTVTTSGLSSEARASGVLTNTIPKEGGNSYRGSFLGNFANNSFQSNNLTDELKAKGLTRVNSAKKLWDANPTIGGPIAKDRVWFYAAAPWQRSQSSNVGVDPQYARAYVASSDRDVDRRAKHGTYLPNVGITPQYGGNRAHARYRRVGIERQGTFGCQPNVETARQQQLPKRLPHSGCQHHHVEKHRGGDCHTKPPARVSRRSRYGG